MVTKKILLLCIPLALAGCNAIDASADGGYGDYHFHDVLKPHGRARSEAALQADASTCERRTGHGDTLADLPKMQADPRYRNCLAARGWQFYAYTPAPVSRHHHEEEASTEQRPSYMAPHDAFIDNNETQRGIDDMNATIAADAAQAAAAAALAPPSN
jgi:hypothetical protein